MKNEITRAEKLSEALSGIDDDLLDEALRIDSARKLKKKERQEYAIRNPLGKIVAVAASLVFVAGIVSAIPQFNVFQNSDFQTTVVESTSTVDPNYEAIRPIGAVLNFDSMEDLADFLAALKTTPSAYNDYCLKNGVAEQLPFEVAKKIADSILASEYHVRLKDGVKAESFTALYTDEGILRLAFTVGQTKYVFSHFYGITSTADHGKDRALGTVALGGATVAVFSGEDHVFADEVFGNTRIYIAAFTDCAEEDVFSAFEIVPTSEAFKN